MSEPRFEGSRIKVRQEKANAKKWVKPDSLLGASSEEVRKWAERYLRSCGIQAVSVGELLQLALRQDGTNPGITKTKLRRAAAPLPREQGQPSRRLAS